MKTTLYIPKMDCPIEMNLIRSQLQSQKGIQNLEFNLIQRELIITHDSALSSIQALLKSIGMESHLKKNGGSEQALKMLHQGVSIKDWLFISISGILAVAAEIIALLSKTETSFAVIVLSIISMVIGGHQTLLKGLKAFRYFNLNINFLMSIAIGGAILIGEWPEAAMVTFLFGLAELIEIYSLDKARKAVRGLIELAPDKATIQTTRGWQLKPVSNIAIDNIIWVKPGERIPLDGIVTKGKTTINQAPITGESMPVEKKEGDLVFAGSLNERGSFEFRVNVNPGNTVLAKIIRTIEEAQSKRAPTQRFVDQFALYYTPVMVILALLLAVIPPLLFSSAFLPWIYKALVLLVIACPCALVISTPVTIVSGLTAAAHQGLLIKGGNYLEMGHRLKAIALDKTGTLTYGKPKLIDILLLSDEFSEQEVLKLAASLEVHSEHPIATAIVAYWQKQQFSSNNVFSVENFEAIPGCGVVGTINEKVYFLGNHHFAEMKKVCNPQIEDQLAQFEKAGKTTIILGTEKRAIGILTVADTVRDTASSSLKLLHQLGISTVMMTGDNPMTAQTIAKKLGIDKIQANLLPNDKLKIMDDLLKNFKVVGMVGDGINDAPALAKASIGFAMGHGGTDIALETADVVLMEDNLNKLPIFISLSRRTWHKLLGNITLSIGIKLIFFILALFGIATLWMAVFADMGASLIVVLNGLRLCHVRHSL